MESVVVSMPRWLWLTVFPYTTLFRSWAGSLSLVAVRVLASASVSFARTLAAVLSSTVTVPPSATVALSLLAAGASLTGVTVIETVAVALHLGSATGGEPVVPLSQEIGRGVV